MMDDMRVCSDKLEPLPDNNYNDSQDMKSTDFIMSVGDINSAEMGTGARANSGKPPLELLPIKQLQYLYIHEREIMNNLESGVDANDVLREFASFQGGHTTAHSLLKRVVAYSWKFSPDIDNIFQALYETAYVWDYGRKKYAAWNWAKGMPWSVPLACALRHMEYTIYAPDELDVDSNLSHFAHVICNVMMLAHYELYWHEVGVNADDRPLGYFGQIEGDLDV